VVSNFPEYVALEETLDFIDGKHGLEEKIEAFMDLFMGFQEIQEGLNRRRLFPQVRAYLFSVAQACASGMMEYVSANLHRIREALDTKPFAADKDLDNLINAMGTYVSFLTGAGFESYDRKHFREFMLDRARSLAIFCAKGFDYYDEQIGESYMAGREPKFDSRISILLDDMEHLRPFLSVKDKVTQSLIYKAATRFRNMVKYEIYFLTDDVEKSASDGETEYIVTRLNMLAEDLMYILPFTRDKQRLVPIAYDLVFSMANFADYWVIAPATFEDGVQLYERAIELYKDFTSRFKTCGIPFSSTVVKDAEELTTLVINSAGLRRLYLEGPNGVKSVQHFMNLRNELMSLA
jgi:hypothetical protein